MTDLAPGRSDGGRGGARLSEAVESVIRDALEKRFLSRQRLSLTVVYRDIARTCTAQSLPVPARGTVSRRVGRLHPAQVAQRREGSAVARTLRGVGGTPPVVLVPLGQVRVDHTVIDVIVVDEHDRQPIGRAYLTAAIDVFSRCLLGMVVTLEAKSAVSVGLCLGQGCCDKRPWLGGLGVEVDWPMSGKPQQLYVDNAAEFKSEALRRGCEQHGIALSDRPGGQPHYGGIVERAIGTAMAKVHELPGTTFSNPTDRGGYDADAKAVLTLRELERWLVWAVASYHGNVYSELHQTPAGRWAEGVAEHGVPPVVPSPTATVSLAGEGRPVLNRRWGCSRRTSDNERPGVHSVSQAPRPFGRPRHQTRRVSIIMGSLKARGALVAAAAGATLAAQVMMTPSPAALAETGPAASPVSTAPSVLARRGTPTPTRTTAVSFVGAAHSLPGSARFKAVAVPTAARAGDQALLVFTHAARVTWAGPSGIAGWRQVASTSANGLVSTVYSKTLAPGDLHGAVRFDAPAYVKAVLTLGIYSGVSDRAALTAVAGSDRGATRHVTPAVTASPGDRVISYWADHRSSTTSWMTSDATTRDTAIGTGGGRYGALLADSIAPSSVGVVPGRVGVTNVSTNAVTWTMRLSGGSQPPPPPPTSTTVTKLLVIVEENETTQAYAKMPYLKGLSNTYGKATSYIGLVHPSLGNYLAMVSGQGTATCGLGDPLPARCPQSGPTVFGRALSAGKTARTYAESMRTPCQTANSTGYAARHNPWAYFTDERAGCAAHSVPLGTTTSGALRSDITAGSLPNAGMIVPNLQHDAHDGTLGQADAWLRTWMPQIIAGPDYRSGRLAVVVTFDEGTGANQNIPFVMVHPSLSAKVVTGRYTHFGLSRLYTDVLGVSPLGAASTEPGLGASFGL